MSILSFWANISRNCLFHIPPILLSFDECLPFPELESEAYTISQGSEASALQQFIARRFLVPIWTNQGNEALVVKHRNLILPQDNRKWVGIKSCSYSFSKPKSVRVHSYLLSAKMEIYINTLLNTVSKKNLGYNRMIWIYTSHFEAYCCPKIVRQCLTALQSFSRKK